MIVHIYIYKKKLKYNRVDIQPDKVISSNEVVFVRVSAFMSY
jgi:hypothetical protein